MKSIKGLIACCLFTLIKPLTLSWKEISLELWSHSLKNTQQKIKRIKLKSICLNVLLSINAPFFFFLDRKQSLLLSISKQWT